MTEHIARARGRRGKGLRGRAARKRKADLGHNQSRHRWSTR